jgi:catechol 2,3-dioxygenase-like lactoylglutathione lyase family enzyme
MLHPGLVVADVRAAADYYTEKLGFTLAFTEGDPPRFARVNLGQVSVHLVLGTPGSPADSVYFVIDDIESYYAFHIAQGVPILHAPTDQPYALRDYFVRDPFGHTLGFGQRIYKCGPPVEIERVDVPVRLEKRLAAVLADLAAHKKMSVSSCLEETLMHTFEPYGDGVASPHTKADLRTIAELKKKHGLDYDCHASYRFVER